MSMKRQVSYRWRLREMMAAHGVFTATELVPLLHEHGIDLSASQVHRLVAGTPERLSLPVLAALCDILEVTPADLVVTTAANVAPRKAGAGDVPAPVDLATAGPSAPACDRTDESHLHRRAVRTLVRPRLRPLRPAQQLHCPVA
jgi:DNA-binding Xre family transcriptional regulator